MYFTYQVQIKGKNKQTKKKKKEGNGNPLQYSCLENPENPVDGAW